MSAKGMMAALISLVSLLGLGGAGVGVMGLMDHDHKDTVTAALEEEFIREIRAMADVRIKQYQMLSNIFLNQVERSPSSAPSRIEQPPSTRGGETEKSSPPTPSIAPSLIPHAHANGGDGTEASSESDHECHHECMMRMEQESEADETLAKKQPGPCDVDPDLIEKVRGYAAETANGEKHVERWNRVLSAFGVRIPGPEGMMMADEAEEYEARGWKRWIPVVAQLKVLEDPSCAK